MTTRLIDPRFLFRFSAPLSYADPLWNDKGLRLGEKHALAQFGQLDDQPAFADVRMAWNETGIAFTVQVRGKRQSLWCRAARMEESDGVQIWIDTRATLNIHRATRFCHRFAFLPAGDESKPKQPAADQLLVRRARENSRPVRPDQLKVLSRVGPDGYQLSGLIPDHALTGFDPGENQRLGFNYAVYDRELGLQTFSVGPQMPYEEDPSTWALLELVRP